MILSLLFSASVFAQVVASPSPAPAPVVIDSCRLRTDLQYVVVIFEPARNTNDAGSPSGDNPSLIPHRVDIDVQYYGKSGWVTTNGKYDSYSAPYTETLAMIGTQRVNRFRRADVQCRVARVVFEDGTDWRGPGPWSSGEVFRP